MSNIILVVKVKVKEEFTQEVYTFMKALHKLTHELDSGCIQYDLHKVKEEESMFCFIETWENQESLDEHMQKGHFKNFMEFTDGKVEEIKIDFLEKYVE
ncbi:putative quinol monooxygenase [Arcobacter sp. LA11]|uniref:putative quinol monooxygenase n=1 Tax=Arcobacter sp. LA11 TaxID=1898176 RepID=UPI000932D24A|nr:putative quinol monooxygenase [Arcobacter sp. LA11]